VRGPGLDEVAQGVAVARRTERLCVLKKMLDSAGRQQSTETRKTYR